MICGGDTVHMTLCSTDYGTYCSGDTTLELRRFGTRVAYNDDYCGTCSRIDYSVSVSWSCTYYDINAGCYSYGCSGTGLFWVSSAPPTPEPSPYPISRPTQSPSRRPTLYPSQYPTFDPSPRPTISPTKSPSSLPVGKPTAFPTQATTKYPTSPPTFLPSKRPSPEPSRTPTLTPPTSQPSSIPSFEPTSPSSIPTGQPSPYPTPPPFYGFHYKYAPYVIPPPIGIITLMGVFLCGDYTLISAFFFPTLDLISDLLYFMMNDFANIELFLLVPSFVFLIPAIYLPYIIIRDQVYIPSPLVFLKYFWIFSIQGRDLYIYQTKLPFSELSNFPVFLMFSLSLICSFLTQLVIFLLASILYLLILMIWIIIGVVLVQTKMFSVSYFATKWTESFFFFKEVTPVSTIALPPNVPSISRTSYVHLKDFHLLIVLEIFCETLPQLIIQTRNNQLLHSWSTISLLSTSTGGFILLTEMYHYGYWILIKSTSLKSVPLEKFHSKRSQQKPKQQRIEMVLSAADVALGFANKT
jgi:hypothetical protein